MNLRSHIKRMNEQAASSATPVETFIRLDFYRIPQGDQEKWGLGPVPFQEGDTLRVRWRDGSITEEAFHAGGSNGAFIAVENRGLEVRVPLTDLDVSVRSILDACIRAAVDERDAAKAQADADCSASITAVREVMQTFGWT